jgi:hypothetical protein
MVVDNCIMQIQPILKDIKFSKSIKIIAGVLRDNLLFQGVNAVMPLLVITRARRDP